MLVYVFSHFECYCDDADVKDLIASATPGRVAGFIAETIQGVGGAVPLADGYLPAVYEVSHRLMV
jgi:4-aminobutyrate aminotransferase-like enzyme